MKSKTTKSMRDLLCFAWLLLSLPLYTYGQNCEETRDQCHPSSYQVVDACPQENPCDPDEELDPTQFGKIYYFYSDLDVKRNNQNQGTVYNLPVLTFIEHPFVENTYQIRICYAHKDNQITLEADQFSYCEDVKILETQSPVFIPLDILEKIMKLIRLRWQGQDNAEILFEGFTLPFAFTKIFKLKKASQAAQIAYTVGTDLAFWHYLVDLEYYRNREGLTFARPDALMVVKNLKLVEISQFTAEILSWLKQERQTVGLKHQVLKISNKKVCHHLTPNTLCLEYTYHESREAR